MTRTPSEWATEEADRRAGNPDGPAILGLVAKGYRRALALLLDETRVPEEDVAKARHIIAAMRNRGAYDPEDAARLLTRHIIREPEPVVDPLVEFLEFHMTGPEHRKVFAAALREKFNVTPKETDRD